ncbi:MAG: AAA family ATPase [Caulobacter sp.]|nr:AAA family ATPase [Caulobacter sp.]
MIAKASFGFKEGGSFDENIAAYALDLVAQDVVLGPKLSSLLGSLADGSTEKTVILDALMAELEATKPDEKGAKAEVDPANGSAGASPPPVKQRGWFLEALDVEGFRGVNNEGAPLALKFKPDAVNSISAPNGVGKSSIYDALSYAITGRIPKLDELQASERGQDYYLNRFHSKSLGVIKLTVQPDDGGKAITVSITLDASGKRTVTTSDGSDGEALLSELDREFVLLDSYTFQRFIDFKSLDRGRAFAGLLGLSRYSALRGALQALSYSRSFNSHFDVNGRKAVKASADKAVTDATVAIATDFEALVKAAYDPTKGREAAQAECHAALHGTPLLKGHCEGKTFTAIDLDECLTTVQAAEGGVKKTRHGELIRLVAEWTAAHDKGPGDPEFESLLKLVKARDDALVATPGETFRDLFDLSQQVLLSEGWPSPNLCPTCDKDDGTSVLESVKAKLAQYDKVQTCQEAAVLEWAENGWAEFDALQTLVGSDGEKRRAKSLLATGAEGSLTEALATELTELTKTLRSRAATQIETYVTERVQLERELPPSLVEVTKSVETSRRLQKGWVTLAQAETNAANEAARAKRVTRLKDILDRACQTFADAESEMAAARLKNIEPLCRDLFQRIMLSPVVPSLLKPAGTEELGIKLAEFWTLKDVSAQALLSESYRNAFAVSVYLAAASLYGGAPRFIVLDDITSSFDAGHQHHLVEVIRTRFGRPGNANGPQIIFLSHDTLLEKLFNKHAATKDWRHQRLEGTAQTAVLLQTGASNKVRDTTNELLKAGRVDDAAPRIRQYLEYQLGEVINRCRIPVLMDIAFNDEKRTAGELMSAIETAVKLHQGAKDIILTAAQQAGMTTHSAMIVGNYLSHWATGQGAAFSAPALQGVMQAIDDFVDCFKHEPTPGAEKKFYRSLSNK